MNRGDEKRQLTVVDELGVTWTIAALERRGVVLSLDRCNREEWHSTRLVFESLEGRKVLAAAPPGWSLLSESELRELLARASSVPMRR